ncbi:MAG: hypothetical protein IPO67_16040 [Deltaproteobacteria bacterium]|nr:hypothetical protein [Deltaproteobacteria bacterium]
MALLPLLVALSAPAAAQQVESMLPVMDDLGTLITKLEGDGFQITDMTLGIAFEGAAPTVVPVPVGQDDNVMMVAVGDKDRIEDLDLLVYDDRGQLVGQDDMTDNTPIVGFQALRSGLYEAQVVVARSKAEYSGGFFTMVTSYPIGQMPISTASTWQIARTAVELLELEGYQVYHGEWETVMEEGAAGFLLPLEAGRLCRAVAVGSPERAKKVRLHVVDGYDQAIGEGEHDGIYSVVDFFSTGDPNTMFVVQASKLKRKITDTHAVVIVACK